MLEEIKQLAIAQQQLAKQAVTNYKPLVNNIVTDGETDQKLIEQMLDGMLDFCFDANMLLLYKKLCRYYFPINPQATASYVYSYRDMWDDDYNSKLENAKT